MASTGIPVRSKSPRGTFCSIRIKAPVFTEPIFSAAFTISSTVRCAALSSVSSELLAKAVKNFPLPSCSSAFRSSGWNTTITAMMPTEMVLERIQRIVFSFKSMATAARAKITRIPLNSTHARVSLIQNMIL